MSLFITNKPVFSCLQDGAVDAVCFDQCVCVDVEHGRCERRWDVTAASTTTTTTTATCKVCLLSKHMWWVWKQCVCWVNTYVWTQDWLIWYSYQFWRDVLHGVAIDTHLVIRNIVVCWSSFILIGLHVFGCFAYEIVFLCFFCSLCVSL